MAMSGPPSLESFELSALGTDLLRRATSLLAGEAVRLKPTQAIHGQELDQLDVARTSAGPTETLERIRQRPESSASPKDARPLDLEGTAPTIESVSAALNSAKPEDLQARGAELLQTLLSVLARGRDDNEGSRDDRVPLIRAAAPAEAGASACATLQITNEEETPSEVSFYASNFVADSGYELPSLLVSIAPRVAMLAAGAAAMFEIKIVVPAQAPPGLYSGLVQATGCKYVKAVVVFEVL
jgi:hypothetical protein